MSNKALTQLDHIRKKHLLWRAGFGLTLREWSALPDQSTDEILESMFAAAKKARKLDVAIPVPAEAYSEEFADMTRMEQKPLRRLRRRLKFDVANAWLGRMADPAHSALLEKLCLFWHGHFACISPRSNLAQDQLMTIRKYAMGNFGELVLAISKDPSMMDFLNARQNKKQSPNENFARELMELFTLGRGHYTERDVKEAARAFTGWSYDDQGNFQIIEKHQDTGEKTFLGRTGNWGGEDIIRIILEQKRCAEFLAEKLLRFYLGTEKANDLVEKLADQLYDNQYNVESAIRFLLESEEFYRTEYMADKIKSPIELLAGMMRQLNIRFTRSENALYLLTMLDQEMFHPPNVSGWPEGRGWINSASIANRTNLLRMLLMVDLYEIELKELPETEHIEKQQRRFSDLQVDFKDFPRMFDDRSKVGTLSALMDFCYVDKSVELQEVESLSDPGTPDFYREAFLYMMSYPEYQLH